MELRHFINRFLSVPEEDRPSWWAEYQKALAADTRWSWRAQDDAMEAIATDPVVRPKFLSLPAAVKEKVLLLVSAGIYGRVLLDE